MKTLYQLNHLEVLDNPNRYQELLALFSTRPFTLADSPVKQRCLWLYFEEPEKSLWRSPTSIINIEQIPEGYIIKTRTEIYHIYKYKQS